MHQDGSYRNYIGGQDRGEEQKRWRERNKDGGASRRNLNTEVIPFVGQEVYGAHNKKTYKKHHIPGKQRQLIWPLNMHTHEKQVVKLKGFNENVTQRVQQHRNGELPTHL